jgi:SAM-dependent methyltransferase
LNANEEAIVFNDCSKLLGMSFYQKTLVQLGWPREATVLVVCGGDLDRDVFLTAGFVNVTVSNLDQRVLNADAYAPCAWRFEDAEKLSAANNSFDYVEVHAGLHHCASPHAALLEMYRVASKGVLCFEARDSLLMRLGKRLGLVPDYELGAVLANGLQWGGVRNTRVPNYVYRWTENEVEKTIASNAPCSPHTVRFFYGMQIPYDRLPYAHRPAFAWIRSVVASIGTLSEKMVPKQCNLFAFFIEKPDAANVFPWLTREHQFNTAYSGIGRKSDLTPSEQAPSNSHA